MKHLTDYINQLQAHGEVFFISGQAKKALNISRQALNISLSRARKKGIITTVAKNFHLILRPEYQILKCLPANYFISFLMGYWGVDYYVALLSAAECYGAAHQKPQIYQIIVSKRVNPIRCGKVAIDFIYKKDLTNLPINKFEGPTGYYKVSSPELTAMDLLLYPKQVGGINRIATILEELTDSIDIKKLLELAKTSKKLNWLQRLGFILEQTISPNDEQKHIELIRVLKKYLRQQSPRYVPLTSGNTKSKSKNKDWHIIVNTKIEGDL
ncbi:MAG: type IV toxin-antitoxin system AbiEi family antitoxin [Gammaproteobacteria bacterium]|nr:type IV toxin-antitoxin system AbiEi family antitoxin [Gammaproteobacteria bacterium]